MKNSAAHIGIYDNDITEGRPVLIDDGISVYVGCHRNVCAGDKSCSVTTKIVSLSASNSRASIT